MSIGETLAAARRDAGLTIVDVGRSTRIRETIISGIESDDFSLCGGDFYARGHIRSIAQAVGTDPQPLVEQYDQEHGGSPRAANPAIGLGASAIPADRPRRRPNVSMVMAALLLVVVVFGVFQLLDGSTDSNSSGNTGEVPGPVAKATDSRSAAPEATSSPARSTSPEPRAKPSPKPAAASIRLVARAPTWISASGSRGEQFYKGTLYSGEAMRFTDKKIIRLVIGNLGGVSLTINGKNFGVIGESGAVEGLRVYPDRVEGISATTGEAVD